MYFYITLYALVFEGQIRRQKIQRRVSPFVIQYKLSYYEFPPLLNDAGKATQIINGKHFPLYTNSAARFTHSHKHVISTCKIDAIH
jgi:hypothetical protein